MRRFFKYILFFVIVFSTFNTNAYFYNEYYNQSITNFINSPDKNDLVYIKDEATRYCEQVYLEATRRRDYTEIEIAICSDIFEIKRQEELDYINYMYRNRGIY